MNRNNKPWDQYVTPSITTVNCCHEGVLCASGDDHVFENEKFKDCKDYGADGWN